MWIYVLGLSDSLNSRNLLATSTVSKFMFNSIFTMYPNDVVFKHSYIIYIAFLFIVILNKITYHICLLLINNPMIIYFLINNAFHLCQNTEEKI